MKTIKSYSNVSCGLIAKWSYRRLVAGLAVLTVMFSACSENIPVEQKDWDGTTNYYASTDEKQSTTYYKPSAGFVGDPMPFFDPVAQDFKVLYLQEFRPNMPGTYHPFWGVQTKDVAHYASLNEVLPTGSIAEADAALGTGCVVYNETDQLYYIFYTANRHLPKVGEDAQIIMKATSPDFKTWTKDPLFRLRGVEYAYSSTDFRDPFVFFNDEDKLWHMIVTTKVGGKGNLAEFSSTDLNNWSHVGIFMPMMWDRFYECPDVFKMGEYWYLIYSEMHSAVRRVQYFKGHTLAELKACTAGDAGIWPDNHEGFLDSRGFYAGKTASDGTNRYIWGWCPTREGNNNAKTNSGSEPQWAGSLVAHRLIQHEDGTLTLGEVPGIKDKYAQTKEIKLMAQSETGVTPDNGGGYKLEPNSYALFNRLDYHNHLSMTITTDEATDKFGFSFCRGTNSQSTDSVKYYTIIVNPESATTRKVNFEEEGPEGKGFIEAIDGYVFNSPADNTYHIDIYTDNSVCVVYINDNVCYTNRIYGNQHNCWSINSYNGNITISNLKRTHY
ncbi:MAG: DUF4975 domain-containing protein [Paludibacteraceae bacterium]|nr:DUF4975 domain-containing protein [Paludibacteraceae bacterium]